MSLIVLENRYLRLELDSETGNLLRVHNRPQGLELIDVRQGGPPRRVEVPERGGWVEEMASFTWSRDAAYRAGQAVDLRWAAADGLTVEARIELDWDDPNARLEVRAVSRGGLSIDKVEYPILRGIGGLGDPGASRLAHPQGTGFLFHDPLHLFGRGPGARQGLRHSPYPEGFGGASMQFMTYYREGRGGFYLATHDPGRHLKWLNFFKGAGGALESAFVHQSPDVHPGNGLRVPYPVLIGSLFEGTWYEAADRYKAWAVRQSWTSGGPLWSRPDRVGWLLEEAGYATFGVNAAHDRSAWLERFQALLRLPGFHILGPNWPKAGADFHNHLPGGREDWFPASFSQANLEAIRSAGDHWAAFEFDLLLNPSGAEAEAVQQALLRLPEKTYSLTGYGFPFVCPLSPFVRELHRWRDETLARDYGVDALYYDISANNLLMAGRNPDHGHPVGGGPWMVDAVTRLYQEARQAASQARGRSVPLGTEMITELMIPYVDYYQARAEAGPLAVFEGDFFRDWVKRGRAEKIPLFTYVYHEYGPLRLDGWGKLSRQVGELFYWAAARVALWGGLFELNYEWSPLEALEGRTEDPAEHYYAFEPRDYDLDPAKAAFVRQLGQARTGFARDYLVYGTMLRPLPVRGPAVGLDYFLYNAPRRSPSYEERGRMKVDALVHSAWRYRDRKAGLLFLNLQPERSLPLRLELEPGRYGLARGDYEVSLVTARGRRGLGTVGDRGSFEVELAPRQVTLVELTPAGEG